MNQNQLAFIKILYGDTCGFAEILAGRRNPSRPDKIDIKSLILKTRLFIYLNPNDPNTYAKFLAYADKLKEQYGNVYISVRLYSDDERKEEYALPSHVIFQDDAPDSSPLPYSVILRTSENSKQCLYIVKEEVTKELCKRVTYGLGSDRSGYDLTQIIRLPDTFNTKIKTLIDADGNKTVTEGNFAVTLEALTNIVHTIETIEATFPEIVEVAPVARSKAATATQEVLPLSDTFWSREVAEARSNIEGIRRRISGSLKKSKGDTRIILGPNFDGKGTMKPFGRMKADESTSMNRCVVANGLVQIGLPDDDIAAYLYKYCEWGALTGGSGRRIKGSRWLMEDIERCIAHARKHNPQFIPSETTSGIDKMGPPEPIKEVPAGRKGRPVAVNAVQYAEDLLDYVTEEGTVLGTHQEQADHYKTSISTIQRCERELRKAGAIKRVPTSNQQSSYLEVDVEVTIAYIRSVKNAPERSVKNAPERSVNNRIEGKTDGRSQEAVCSTDTPSVHIDIYGGYTPRAAAPSSVAMSLDNDYTVDATVADVVAPGVAVCIPDVTTAEPQTLDDDDEVSYDELDGIFDTYRLEMRQEQEAKAAARTVEVPAIVKPVKMTTMYYDGNDEEEEVLHNYVPLEALGRADDRYYIPLEAMSYEGNDEHDLVAVLRPTSDKTEEAPNGTTQIKRSPVDLRAVPIERVPPSSLQARRRELAMAA